MTSRRAVLGSALGGTALAALPQAAQAAQAESAGPAGVAAVVTRTPWKLRNRMDSDSAWSGFLREQDLLWRRLPTLWHEGPFLGDGRLGSMIYREPGANAVRFTVQHGEVQDHRPELGSGWGTCRLPVGHLTLDPAGTITGVNWRLSLWNAELTGTITTDKGTLTLAALIHDGVLAARVTADGDEEVHWTFHPEDAISPRRISEAPPADYVPNPPWTTRTTGDIEQVLQPLTGGGQTATAYRHSGDTLVLTVAHSHPSDTRAGDTSLGAIRRTAASYAALRTPHTRHWHAYYRKSFVSFPDERLQRFYWIQLYKVASAAPRARPRWPPAAPGWNPRRGRHLVEPQRPAGVLADPRLQPPGTRLAGHHRPPEPGTTDRERAHRLPLGQCRNRPQLRHVRQPVGVGLPARNRRPEVAI